MIGVKKRSRFLTASGRTKSSMPTSPALWGRLSVPYAEPTGGAAWTSVRWTKTFVQPRRDRADERDRGRYRAGATATDPPLPASPRDRPGDGRQRRGRRHPAFVLRGLPAARHRRAGDHPGGGDALPDQRGARQVRRGARSNQPTYSSPDSAGDKAADILRCDSFSHTGLRPTKLRSYSGPRQTGYMSTRVAGHVGG